MSAAPRPPLWQASAAALQQAFANGTATPLQALDSCLQRIAEVQPQLNAFVALRAAAARDEARASTQRHAAGRPLSPLDGVPVSIKDNLLTRDMPTTWGTRALRQYQPGHEELAVTRLRAAGAIIVGKTNVPEFTLEGYTDNPLFGVTRNPWNPALTPGGSSGGAAASLAAGCTPLALGTDGGGSIRRPAAHCGVLGLKPTLGTIARTHGLPTLLLDYEVVGLMARTVSDLRLLLAVVEGPDIGDMSSWAAQALRARPDGAHAPLRMLYAATLDAAPVDPGIAAACARAVRQGCAEHGHRLEHGALPLDLQALNQGWPRVAQMGLAQMFDAHPEWGAQASEKYRAIARQGMERGAAELWQLLDTTAQLRRDCAQMFMQWDVVAMPCTAAQPWPAREAYPAEIDGRAVGPRGHAVFTGWVNAAGLPAISVPVGFDANGLPIGLQLVARPGAEPLLLQLAQQLQPRPGSAPAWPPL